MKPIPTAVEAYVILLLEQVHQEMRKNVNIDDQDPIVCRVKKRESYYSRFKGKGEYFGAKGKVMFSSMIIAKLMAILKIDVGNYMDILPNSRTTHGGRKIK